MKNRKILINIGILLFLLIGIIILIRNAGTYLIRTDPSHKSNAMILLMGSIPDRVIQAADLYKDGNAGKLIIVEESMGAYKDLEDRGIHIISNSKQCLNAAVSLRIPADSITTLIGDARSTQDEAIIVRNYLKNQPSIRAITLVTSPDHTRRASMIFKKAFKKGGMQVAVYSCPSKYSSYTGIGWWKHKEDIQTVVLEYVKIVNFMLIDQFVL